MGKSEKVGGIGKSPAIERLNRFQQELTSDRMAEMLRESMFETVHKDVEIDKIGEIIDQYHINYEISKREK